MNATADAKGKLELLRLRGAAAGLERIPERAQADTATYRDFLECVLDAELRDRNERRLKRNLTGAHSPARKRIEDFTFDLVKGITKRDALELADCSWVDATRTSSSSARRGSGRPTLSSRNSMNGLRSS